MKLDRCGAAAILIALEFARIYKTNTEADELTFAKFYSERIIKKLYPGKCNAEPERKDIKTISRFQTCPKCGWKTSKGREAMLSHQRQKCIE